MISKNSKSLWFFVVLVVAVGLSPQLSDADSPTKNPSMTAEEIEELSQEISEVTMSPFCPGRTLSSCPSPQARELKKQIQEWVTEGYTKAAVRRQLLGMFGEEVRGTPKAEGFGLMAWIVPIIFVLLFFLLVTYTLRRLRKPDVVVQTEPVSKEVQPEMERRIEEELRKRQST